MHEWRHSIASLVIVYPLISLGTRFFSGCETVMRTMSTHTKSHLARTVISSSSMTSDRAAHSFAFEFIFFLFSLWWERINTNIARWHNTMKRRILTIHTVVWYISDFCTGWRLLHFQIATACWSWRRSVAHNCGFLYASWSSLVCITMRHARFSRGHPIHIVLWNEWIDHNVTSAFQDIFYLIFNRHIQTVNPI